MTSLIPLDLNGHMADRGRVMAHDLRIREMCEYTFQGHGYPMHGIAAEAHRIKSTVSCYY
jgi:hypothetical protein